MNICAILPAYRVERQILTVIQQIDTTVCRIYVVDDACPNGSGKLVEQQCTDPRVTVLYNPVNLGVGGAVLRGYEAGLADGMDVFAKIDGDGQMDPALLPRFLKPILNDQADYTKGNRFFHLESLAAMPMVRKVGNACLSLINKFSSGYWDIMDPTNGYTVIHRSALELLPLDKINNRYFFESDMLFRLGTIKAVVRDIPMDAIYADETSSLSISHTAMAFMPLYIKAFWKRFFYTYLLRDFSIASLESLAGVLLFGFGLLFGLSSWQAAASLGAFTSPGTVMLAAVPMIMGFQLLLSAMHYDINNVPKIPLQDQL